MANKKGAIEGSLIEGWISKNFRGRKKFAKQLFRSWIDSDPLANQEPTLPMAALAFLRMSPRRGT
jgi:hypothetical protein